MILNRSVPTDTGLTRVTYRNLEVAIRRLSEGDVVDPFGRGKILK